MKSTSQTKKIVLKYGELFCGPGGLALGAIQAAARHPVYSVKHIWANDIDPDACSTYRLNICKDINDQSVVPGDVRDPDEFDIELQKKIDILAFGFPCNDFSLVAEKKGLEGQYGPLYSYGVKAIEYHKPRVFIAENVGGLRSSAEGKTFDLILNKLSKAGNGYRLTVHKFQFENYGVPQKRHRIVIVGIKKGSHKRFEVPKEPPRFLKNPVTCEKAFADIKPNHPNQIPTNNSEIVQKRLEYIKEGRNIWEAQKNGKIPDEYRLKVKTLHMSNIYRRIHSKEPAYTVTGSGGGGTHMYHWSENRALTNRERARLQTFPNTYKFEGSKEAVRKQIGMAVPVLGAKIIFKAVLDTLAGKKYKIINPSFGYIE